MDLELSPGDRAFRDGFRRWLRELHAAGWLGIAETALDLLGPAGPLAQRGLGLPRGA